MDTNRDNEDKTVAFLTEERAITIREFAQTEVFSKLFTTGMDMVEETANYLDGQGREDSRSLPRKVSLAYAGESMRLTTRLMQIASWLLVQRAVREGELTAQDAAAKKYRMTGTGLSDVPPIEGAHLLPDGLVDLIRRSEALYDRIERLDRSLFIDPPKPSKAPVREHQKRLEAAFGTAL